jgi:uncharacterized protein (TIRG00374 family)
MSVEVSVVLPAYNEEATIEHTVSVTLETLASFLPADVFEVIVAEDGCEDRTPEIATRLAESDPRVRHFHSDERLGRGGALEQAFRAADGETLVYFDTDLATDMRHLEELVESIRSEGYDVATGSRRMPGRKQDREPERGVASTGFNTLVRLFLRSDLYDHQCGFKAFDREALLTLLDDVEDDHWFWDTEVLVRAQRGGYRVTEFPVEWTPQGDTKVDLVRDVFGMGSQILRVWWEFSVRPRASRRVALLAGTLLVVAALALMTVYLDPSAVLSAIGNADPGLVALSAVVYALSWPLRGARYRDILAELGYDGDLGFLTGAVFISQTGNLVFPARAGDAVRAYVVKARRGVPYPSGFASLAVERVFDLLTITVLAGTVLLGFAAVGLEPSLSGASDDVVASGRTALLVAAGVGVAAVVAVAAIVASARSERDLVRRLFERVSDDSYVEVVVEVVGRFVTDVQTVAADRDAFLRVGGASLLIWTLDVVTAIVVFRAFTATPSVPDLPLVPLVALSFFAVSVGNLAKVLPLSPGGIGLYEGAFTLLVVVLTPALAGVQLTAAVALAIAVVDHAVKNVVTVIGGVASTLLLNVSLTQAVEESADVDPEERALRDD